MHLIVGLGNPGSEYRNHRHNIGFMAVDTIAQRHNFSPFRSKFNGLVAEGNVDGERFLLLKPQTFMNKSGDSVGAAVKFYKIPTEQVIVIYDELDLLPGKLKVKTGGGNGGHNGLRSIDPVIGKEYQRVRLGIGHPGHKDRVTNHVLGNFAKADQNWLEGLLKAISDNLALLAAPNGAGKFMNKIALVTGDTQAPAKALSSKTKPKPQKTEVQPTETTADNADNGPMAAMLKKLFKPK